MIKALMVKLVRILWLKGNQTLRICPNSNPNPKLLKNHHAASYPWRLESSCCETGCPAGTELSFGGFCWATSTEKARQTHSSTFQAELHSQQRIPEAPNKGTKLWQWCKYRIFYLTEQE